jgi:hypothetical protein
MKTQIPIFRLNQIEPVNTSATLTRQPAMSSTVYLLQGALCNDCAASDVTCGIFSASLRRVVFECPHGFSSYEDS